VSKKILIGLMTMVLAVGLVGAGAFAVFSDTETSEDNTFTAGTLDLKVDGQDNPAASYSLGDMKPGDSVCYTWCLKNVGSIPGVPSVEFSAITNNENGTNDPEDDAEAQSYASAGGELGEYLKTCTGYAPCSWGCTISNHLYCNWQTGPTHGWGTPGLNGVGGQTLTLPVLNPGDTVGFILQMSLEDDLQLWDGCGWHDIDDNIIQSDSVEFDIIFHLDQAP